MEDKSKKILNIIKTIAIVLVIIVVIWFSFTLIEFYRVKSDKRPIVCFNEKKDTESSDEYSLTCYGLLYKYREYYMNDDDSLTAREFTLFFKEFKREVSGYENVE